MFIRFKESNKLNKLANSILLSQTPHLEFGIYHCYILPDMLRVHRRSQKDVNWTF